MNLKQFLTDKNLNPNLEEIFKHLCTLTLEWNEKINVTAVKDPDDFIRKNIIDSICLIGREELTNAKRILDLGTGGGYPGVPLAICCPDKEFILMDAVGKKLKVIDAICTELGIKNVTTIHMRAEDMAKDPLYRENFDLVVSRAVANMSTLSEYCVPFVKVGGNFVAYKTDEAEEEIKEAEKALKLLGCPSYNTVPDGIEGSGHNFIICKKTSSTPKKFPRQAGMPSKQPLK